MDWLPHPTMLSVNGTKAVGEMPLGLEPVGNGQPVISSPGSRKDLIPPELQLGLQHIWDELGNCVVAHIEVVPK